MIGRTNTGGGGSGGKIVVTAPAGATVTVSKGGKVKTKVAGEDGVAVFQGLDNGTWRVTLYNEDGSANYSWEVSVSLEYPITVEFFDGYLYNSGDERELFTGGWYCDVDKALKKTSTCMNLYDLTNDTMTQYAFTAIPFDTTGYDTITVNCVSSSMAIGNFGIASEDKKIVSGLLMPGTRGNKTLDISGYQGKYFLYFSCYCPGSETNSGRATVYSVKIE